ncbi:MAG TPA: hypothetical protein PKZ76_09190, partial [Xanthomonadaceae bacterium]|nr:hypothetical protein [Xanthomonadaceae bacterium]
SLAPLAALDLAHGSRPFDVVASSDGSQVFVGSYGRGELLRFDAATRARTGEVALGFGARAVALSDGGASAFVTRFLSPRDESWIWEVDVGAMTLIRTLRLPKFGGDFHRDTSASGRGVANYLADIAVAPGGERLWFVATKPNVERGPLIGPDLNPENTMRTVAVELDTASGALTRAIDIDNSDSASAIGFSPLGDYLFVTLQGNQQLAIFDLLAPAVAQASGALRGRLATGHAPQGLCVDGEVMWVQNLLGRSVTRFDTAALLDSGDASLPSIDVPTVSVETMPAEVLAGKRTFYDAADPRMTSDGYISCASCHLDGGHDGRVWDFSGRGEGLRRTIDLRGRGGMAHGKEHWSANFDEIQDFENDIRLAFGGSGFLSDAEFAMTSDPVGAPKAGLSADLDALAAYVGSLDHASVPRSPWREADGALTAAAGQGAVWFELLGCASCHVPPRFTRSPLAGLDLVDVGTHSDNSGGRLGDVLTGIDVPTLFGLFDGGPYFHDGSAPSLAAVFDVYGGQVIPAESGAVASGAFIESQFLQFNADDTVRGRALVNLDVQGARVTFDSVDGGPGGAGALALRYSAGGASQLAVRVNGQAQTLAVPPTGNATFRPSNWRYLRLADIALLPGPNNQIEIERLHPFVRIELDEFVIGTASERLAAEPHRQVAALAPADRDALIRFLQEIEPGVSVGDPLLIFADGFE